MRGHNEFTGKMVSALCEVATGHSNNFEIKIRREVGLSPATSLTWFRVKIAIRDKEYCRSFITSDTQVDLTGDSNLASCFIDSAVEKINEELGND